MSPYIRGGNFDHGESISTPEGKTLTPNQLKEVTAVVSERQAEVVILLEEEMLRYDTDREQRHPPPPPQQINCIYNILVFVRD